VYTWLVAARGAAVLVRTNVHMQMCGVYPCTQISYAGCTTCDLMHQNANFFSFSSPFVVLENAFFTRDLALVCEKVCSEKAVERQQFAPVSHWCCHSQAVHIARTVVTLCLPQV